VWKRSWPELRTCNDWAKEKNIFIRKKKKQKGRATQLCWVLSNSQINDAIFKNTFVKSLMNENVSKNSSTSPLLYINCCSCLVLMEAPHAVPYLIEFPYVLF